MGGTGFVGVLRCAQDDSKDKQQQGQQQGQGQPQVLRLRGSQNAVSHFAQDDNFWRGWRKTGNSKGEIRGLSTTVAKVRRPVRVGSGSR